MPKVWTPEERKAFGEKMAAQRAAKAAAKASQAATVADDAATPVLNPIATDVVKSAAPAPKPRPKRTPKSIDELAIPDPSNPPWPDYDAKPLIDSLLNLPLAKLSYLQCGDLLNAFASASQRVAQARRERQEQMDAGTQRANCNTCGRPIDISKSGGFQILTERDEHWMPINRYYCSQNCLLARNMPSHEKSTPRQKQANQA